LHSHNWLSFGKFQDTGCFLIHCERHFSSRLPPAVEPGITPRPLVEKKTWRDSVPIDMLISAVCVLVVAQSSSEIPEGLMNNPVLQFPFSFTRHISVFQLNYPSLQSELYICTGGSCIPLVSRVFHEVVVYN